MASKAVQLREGAKRPWGVTLLGWLTICVGVASLLFGIGLVACSIPVNFKEMGGHFIELVAALLAILLVFCSIGIGCIMLGKGLLALQERYRKSLIRLLVCSVVLGSLCIWIAVKGAFHPTHRPSTIQLVPLQMTGILVFALPQLLAVFYLQRPGVKVRFQGGR